MACCHTLEFFRKEVHGSVVEKKAFEFAQAVSTGEDSFETATHQLQVRKVIRFKARAMKLAVLASYRDKPPALRHHSEEELESHKPINPFTAMGKKCSI